MIKMFYWPMIVSLLVMHTKARSLIIQEFGCQNISKITGYSMQMTMASISDVQCAYWCAVRHCLALSFHHISKECKLYDNKPGTTNTIENGVSVDVWFHSNKVLGQVFDPMVETSTHEISTILELKEVAYGKQTQTSNSGDSSGKAVDGDPVSFSSTYADSPYWSVDVGDMYLVKRIEVLARIEFGDDLHNLDINVGATQNSWQLCARFVGPASDGERLSFECNQDGRYVKIAKQGQTGFLELAEVKVYVPV